MKKKDILIFSFIIVFMALLIGVVIDAFNNDDKYVPVINNLTLEENAKIIIKDYKLYDDKNNIYINVDDNKIYEEYKAIAGYDYVDYYFVVFAKNQDSLNDNLFLVEHLDVEKHSSLYLIDKSSGKVLNIGTSLVSPEMFRIDLSTIDFLDKDLFVMANVDFKEPEIFNFTFYKIINKDGIFDILTADLHKQEKIEQYAITKDKLIIKFKQNDNIKGIIYTLNPTFTYETKLIGDKKVIVTSTGSLGFKNINTQYIDEQDIWDNFVKVNDTILYLDNNLVVKELITDKVIETLNSKEEFIDKYK